MELHEIVMRLIGPVQPVGESNADAQRLTNMRSLTELVDRLIGEILRAAPAANRHEDSMKAIGKHAQEFLDDIRW